MKYIISILFFLLINVLSFSQSSNDILNVLVEQNAISQEKADSLRAEYSIKQQTSLPDKKLRIDAEFRPRTEFRNGYQQLRNDTSTGSFFTNQRLRVSASYVLDNRFVMQFSIQDLRVWGQQDPRSTSATLQVFEGWVEPYINNKFSIRIGRQRLIYDNQRLFAENDWRLSAAVHDAINFRFYSPNISSELALAFNQSAERYFGTDYAPSGFTNYKFLAVNYLRYKVNEYLILTALNSTDGYQDKLNPEKMNLRYTLGGRVEFESGSFYTTVSSYFQGGKNNSGRDLSAWYVQPEIRYTSSRDFVARFGAEIFSGNNNSTTDNTDHSFVPLYGVAHRFNGSMDLITKFPADVAGAGLVNPYLFLIQPLFTKIDLRADFHTFHLQQDYYTIDDIKIDRYLGFENDFLITYKPNAVTKVDFGVSYMLPTKSFEIIKNSGNSKYNLTWIYISLTFRPQLLGLNFK
ncbi:MAG: alginate export family protein [Bacteroidales bacterium]|nr:alginate export family protein [Bacteroidales bacterium]